MVSPSDTPTTMPDQAQERQGMIKRKIRSRDRNRAFLFTINLSLLVIGKMQEQDTIEESMLTGFVADHSLDLDSFLLSITKTG
jgi:hypothetical protein